MSQSPKPLPRLPASRYKHITGAGDLVAIVARPVARLIDKAIGTDLVNCGACQGRKEWLNAKMPFDVKG